jgi:hypothetical protein
MDYIPILEMLFVTVAGFILVGTLVGLRRGEVHFPVQWLLEEGFNREHPKFKTVVIANFTIAAALIGISILHLVELSSQ